VERELAALFPGQRHIKLYRKNMAGVADEWTFNFDEDAFLMWLEDRRGTIYDRVALAAKDVDRNEWSSFATRDTDTRCVIVINLTYTYDTAKRGDGVVLSGEYFYDYDLADEALPPAGETWAWCK